MNDELQRRIAHTLREGGPYPVTKARRIPWLAIVVSLQIIILGVMLLD